VEEHDTLRKEIFADEMFKMGNFTDEQFQIKILSIFTLIFSPILSIFRERKNQIFVGLE